LLHFYQQIPNGNGAATTALTGVAMQLFTVLLLLRNPGAQCCAFFYLHAAYNGGSHGIAIPVPPFNSIGSH